MFKMTTFNSLGSNYTASYLLKSLIWIPGAQDKLQEFLSKRYGGETYLFYKGRQAITKALDLAQLPTGSGVLINGYTCLAVWQAVKDAGCEPILIDPPENSLDYTAKELIKSLEKFPNSKAVIVQHTLGYTGSINDIKKVTDKAGLVLIEDLSHSVGASYKEGLEVGMVGDFTVLSFSQDKMIDAVSGGALVDRRSNAVKLSSETRKLPTIQYLRDRLYPFATWTIRHTYTIGLGKALHRIFQKLHIFISPMALTMRGDYYELPSWHSKNALFGLQKLDKNMALRQAKARVYAQNIPSKYLQVNIISTIDRSACLRFPLLVPSSRKTLIKLSKHGYHLTDRWFDAPIAPKKYAALVEYESGSCPNAESVSAKMINLPTHPAISIKKINRLAEEIVKWL